MVYTFLHSLQHVRDCALKLHATWVCCGWREDTDRLEVTS